MVILIFVTMTFWLALIDIAVKSHLEVSIKAGEERSLCKGRVRVRKVHNKGMCLNLLEDRPQLVKKVGTVGTILLTIYQLFTLVRKGQYLKKAGLSLMAAGAWSNTFDRLVRGYVMDYVGFQSKWKRISQITYNFGDFFIAAGTLLVFFSVPFHVQKRNVMLKRLKGKYTRKR